MTRTERLLTILRCLRDAQNRGQRSMTSSSIKDRMVGVYDGDSNNRKWRRDIRLLRERGLIVTDLPPGREGISFRRPTKAGNLHLTRDEHAAINQARDVLRPGVPAVSPLETSIGGTRLEIDEVTRVLRFVEENLGEVEFAELAALLDVPQSRAFDLLDVLTADEVFGEGGIVASVSIGYRDQDDDADDEPIADTVSVYRAGMNTLAPTLRVGMAQLGFFPYSLAETEERLTLIDKALADDGLAAQLGDELRSARSKLDQWRRELQR